MKKKADGMQKHGFKLQSLGLVFASGSGELQYKSRCGYSGFHTSFRPTTSGLLGRG